MAPPLLVVRQVQTVGHARPGVATLRTGIVLRTPPALVASIVVLARRAVRRAVLALPARVVPRARLGEPTLRSPATDAIPSGQCARVTDHREVMPVVVVQVAQVDGRVAPDATRVPTSVSAQSGPTGSSAIVPAVTVRREPQVGPKVRDRRVHVRLATGPIRAAPMVAARIGHGKGPVPTWAWPPVADELLDQTVALIGSARSAVLIGRVRIVAVANGVLPIAGRRSR